MKAGASGLSLLCFSFSLGPQLCSGMGLLALRVGLPQSPSSVEPLWKHAHRHTQMIPNPAKLVKNCEHRL